MVCYQINKQSLFQVGLHVHQNYYDCPTRNLSCTVNLIAGGTVCGVPLHVTLVTAGSRVLIGVTIPCKMFSKFTSGNYHNPPPLPPSLVNWFT